MLSKEQILAATTAKKVKTVTIADFGTVGIRVMTGTEREAWERAIIKDGKVSSDNIRANLLAKCLCDDAGNRLFSDSEIDSVGLLPANVVVPLYDVAQKINALTQTDVDELAKN